MMLISDHVRAAHMDDLNKIYATTGDISDEVKSS